MSKPKVAVITGYGINSDQELAHSFLLAGAEPIRVHINDLIAHKPSLTDFDIIAIPGGFSFGDHIASGRVFANKLKNALADDLYEAVEKKIPLIGICNGFQVLVKLGILPGKLTNKNGVIAIDPTHSFKQTATLTYNDSGRFEDRWCYLKSDAASKCIWTRNIEKIYLPIRHGEGKFIPQDAALLSALQSNGQISFRYCTNEGEAPGTAGPAYPVNPNGSTDHIAGICSEDGLRFGLMPHPEAFMLATNHPQWQKLGLKGEGAGIQIFRNAVELVKG